MPRDSHHVYASGPRAVIALARRRVDVLWALLRDGRLFTLHPPVVQAA